jgi:protein TonB
VVTGSAAIRRRRWLTTSGSVLVHSIGVAATIAMPLLLWSALPEPASAVRAFFVEPLVVPPPPPPPPALARPAAVSRTTPGAVPDRAVGFVALIEVPSELKPEEGLDLGIEGGVVGGVAGGIPGGVIGAVVGGLPESAVEPPPPVRPLRVSGLVKEPAKVRHVNPIYPPVASAARVEGVVILEALVDVQGHVVEVKILQAASSFFEDAAREAVRQWIYTPTLLDGVPVPLIVTVTVTFQLEPPGR